MAQDATVPKLNFGYWLDKAIEWGQATALESQKDVCLHLPQLQEFLHQLSLLLVSLHHFLTLGKKLYRNEAVFKARLEKASNDLV